MGASNDLFDATYTQGDLATIGVVRKWLGTVVVTCISLVGFCIILCVIAKNSLYGLYYVFPNWFDRVDEVKSAEFNLGVLKDAKGFSERVFMSGNTIAKLYGFVMTLVFSICPNIKRLLDIDDEPVDPKQFFAKAIPLACVHIFIGVFIFYGYPGKTAEKFSDFGRYALDIAFLNTDPTTIFAKASERWTDLSLSTDSAKSDYDKGVNKITKAAYNKLVAEFNDMTKVSRQSSAIEIEKWIINKTGEFAPLFDTDSYEMTVVARMEYQSPDIRRVENVSMDGLHQRAFFAPVSDFNTGSTKSEDNKYLRVDLTFREKAISTVSKTLTITASTSLSTTPYANDTSKVKEVKINFGNVTNNVGLYLTKPNSIRFMQSECQAKVEGGVLTIYVTEGANIPVASSYNSISGLKYFDGVSGYHIVSGVSNGSAPATFTVMGDQNWSTFSWGSAPVKKNAGDGSGQQPSGQQPTGISTGQQ